MKDYVADILTKHHLRQTDCRLETLSIFISKNFAISHNDLEEILVPTFDRVTLYRTLKTFLEKGIIHKVLDDEGTPKYALCSPHHCSTQEHHHNHVHFKCYDCGKTQCLDNTIIPTILLPQGFIAKEFNLLIQGSCNLCSQK
jgi:Fur family ferric uptake transcriptional regulator